MHMATALLVAVTLVQLLHSSSALTEWEVDQFKARTHIEHNTGLNGSVGLTEPKGRRYRGFYKLESNGIPDHDTGTFPEKGASPNEIWPQLNEKKIPKQPAIAANPSCLPMGPIAFAKNGVAIFSPLDSQGNNAVDGERPERFDECNGHPNNQGTYHYHQEPVCLLTDTGVNDEFIGVALDGFPIYGNKDFDGYEINSTQLDNCHGRFEVVNCGEYEYLEYRYRVTHDFPYILGCFKGAPSPDIKHKLYNNCEILSVRSEEIEIFEPENCGS